MKSCMIATCDNPSSCKGYCNKHYLRWLRHGDATYRTRVSKNEWSGIKCQIEYCETKVKCKGYCKLHYQRLQRGTL